MPVILVGNRNFQTARRLCVSVFRVTLHKHKLPLIYCRVVRADFITCRIDFSKLSVSGCTMMFTHTHSRLWIHRNTHLLRVCVILANAVKCGQSKSIMDPYHCMLSPVNEVSWHGFMRCQWHSLDFIISYVLCMHAVISIFRNCNEMRANEGGELNIVLNVAKCRCTWTVG